MPPLAHTILHTVMKCCTEKIDIFFVGKNIPKWNEKTQKNKQNKKKKSKIMMWNNAGKVKLGKNMNESKTYLLLPMTWATHDNYPSRGRSRRSPSASALAAEYAWRAEGQLFCIILHLGDHPLPCLHVGRYLDGWGDGAWQKASRKKEGRVLFFILGFLFFCFFVLGCFFFFFCDKPF